jgi:hypothetical protein
MRKSAGTSPTSDVKPVEDRSGEWEKAWGDVVRVNWTFRKKGQISDGDDGGENLGHSFIPAEDFLALAHKRGAQLARLAPPSLRVRHQDSLEYCLFIPVHSSLGSSASLNDCP